MIKTARAGTITVTLPDGQRIEVPRGATVRDVAYQIGEGLGRVAVGARIDGAPEIRDLRTALDRDVALEVVTATSEEGQEVIRHSAAHIMAEAILRLWPGTRLAIGPAVEDGFYYDVDLPHKITPEDFARIEEEMAEIIAEDSPFERVAVDREKVLEQARSEGDTYKAQLIEDIPPGEEVTFYRHDHGRFEDLCRGPHVPSTGYVKAFKLLRTAGAYWRGDERNPMLQRIYGTAWYRKKDLKEHLRRLEEAQKRDHRRLGRELGLFLFHPVAPAMPFFLPKGARLHRRLQDHMRSLYGPHGYEEVITPQVYDVELWHRSGHYDHYRENMYFTRTEGESDCALKPMNCPGHALLFAAEKRSYRDLPLRLADFGRLHRYERSGVTSGLTRVRSFSQDDAHIFCAPGQVQEEIAALIRMVGQAYRDFGFEGVKVFLSTRPEDSVGSDETWQAAEAALAEALESGAVAHRVNPGEGAFYGPKIDFTVRDALKREWQLGTIQLDFSMPERFDLRYTATDGSERRPVVIHRAILGSLERFVAILIEHTGGNFPFWLAPVQARVVSINDSHVPYAREVLERLAGAGFHVDSDLGNAKTGAKVRLARLQRIPFVLVVGDREVEEGTVSVRERPDKDLGKMSVEDLMGLFRDHEEKKR